MPKFFFPAAWRLITVLRGSRIAIRLFDFEAFVGFGKEVRSTLREAANQLSNKLSHAQHLDEVTDANLGSLDRVYESWPTDAPGGGKVIEPSDGDGAGVLILKDDR